MEKEIKEPVLINIGQLCELLCMSRETFPKFLQANKDFPAAIKTSGNGKRWVKATVIKWIETR